MTYSQNEFKNINNEDYDEIDLIPFLLKIKSKWKICLLVTLIGALLGACYATFLVKPLYQSTSMIYLRNSGATVSLQDLQIGSQLTNDYEIIFKSRPIMEKAINDLGLDMTSDELSQNVIISNPEDSRILQITVKAGSPELAKDIANSVTKSGMEVVLEIDSQNPYVIEKAIIETDKVSTSRTKITVVGAALGLLSVVGTLFVGYIVGDKINSADDIEKYIGVPVLAVVPEDKVLDYNKLMKKGR